MVHSVQKVLTPILKTSPPPNTPSPARYMVVFLKYRPNEIPDKLMWQSYFFIFRRLKNNVTCFFYKKYFYKQHPAEI